MPNVPRGGGQSGYPARMGDSVPRVEAATTGLKSPTTGDGHGRGHDHRQDLPEPERDVWGDRLRSRRPARPRPPQSNCEQMHFSRALRAHKSPFAISYGRLAHRHQIGTPGRIPHGIATELFRNGERRHRERSGRGGMGLEGSRGGA